MKLCIVTPNVIKGDGQGRANYEIVCEAIRRGHHVTLLSKTVASELQQSTQIDWIYIAVEKYPTGFLRKHCFLLAEQKLAAKASTRIRSNSSLWMCNLRSWRHKYGAVRT